MILERLIDFHDTTEDIVAASLKEQRVRWYLELSEDGRFLGLSETGAKKADWTPLVTPYTKRSGATPPPYLLVDKPNYVLAHLAEPDKLKAAKREKEQAKADDRHAEYVELVRACAEAVEHPAVDAFIRFLDTGIEEARTQAATLPMKPGDLIAPRVGETILTRLPEVRQFWQAQEDAAADEKSGLVAECMVTGHTAPIARTHPVELLLGPNRVGLVSANENAFLSYGLKQSEIAPMSFTAARKYGEALRHLLNTDRHHLRIGDVTWVYWTREDTGGDVLWAIKEPDLDEVNKLLASIWSGSPRAEIDGNDFYALAVSANTSRMVVRSWITTTVDAVQQNIRTFYERMRLLDRDGQPRFHKYTALAGSLVRDFKDLPPYVTAALLNAALWDQPLPLSLLHQAVQRARAEEHVVTHPRAALIKLIFQSNPELRRKYDMSEQLNPDHSSPAYQCGRLLALLDNIQGEAVGARATLVDRYYGAASATPASVFGVLMRNAQNHLGKLRKTKGGLAYYFEQQIGSIAAQLNAAQGFPRTLTLEEQGIFALGFYQERNRPSKKKGDGDGSTDA